MLRLYRYLSEKRLKLIDLLFLMNRNNTAEISADEFQRRLKVCIRIFIDMKIL